MLPPTTHPPVAASSISRTRSFLFLEVHGCRRRPRPQNPSNAFCATVWSLTFANYGCRPQSDSSRANSMTLLPTDSTLSIPRLAETRDYLPNSSRTPDHLFRQADSDSHSASANSPGLGFDYGMLGMGLLVMSALGTMGDIHAMTR